MPDTAWESLPRALGWDGDEEEDDDLFDDEDVDLEDDEDLEEEEFFDDGEEEFDGEEGVEDLDDEDL